MKKSEYLNKRKELLNQATQALEKNDLELFNTKEKEIKDLDDQFEAFAKAEANMNALKDVPMANRGGDMLTEGEETSTAISNQADEKEQYKNAWAKMMKGMALNQDEQVIMDRFNPKNSTQTAETHSVIIPETVTNDIWREAAEMYPLLADLDMTFVPGDLTILKESSSGTDADWYDEATEATDGEFAIGEINLSGCELIKMIPVSWKLKKMAIDKFIPYITTLLAEKMGAALAKAVVSGKGKPGDGDTFKAQPKGVIVALSAEVSTPQIIEFDDATDKLTYEKLTLAFGKLPSGYKKGASIYANSKTVWNRLANLKDETGKPLFIQDVTAGGVGRIFGIVVKEDDSIEDDGILLGNIKKGYACNVNEDMTIYTEEKVTLRRTNYMAYSLVDGAPRTTKAFVYIRLKEV
ncbi:MAG: phage major capsid protein [Clostridia bacterium]|nr:phage major capsid protein [Clostridia bacterium]